MCMNDDTLTKYNWPLVSTVEVCNNYRVCKHNVDVGFKLAGLHNGHQVSGRPQPRTVDMVVEKECRNVCCSGHDEADALRIAGNYPIMKTYRDET